MSIEKKNDRQWIITPEDIETVPYEINAKTEGLEIDGNIIYWAELEQFINQSWSYYP